jgi:hypothetical protein
VRRTAHVAVVALVALFAALPVLACRFSSAITRPDRERAFVAGVRDEADLIFEARLTRSDQPESDEPYGTWRDADFTVERVLKGQAPATISLQWREGVPAEPIEPEVTGTGEVEIETIATSCIRPPDEFDKVDLNRTGLRYLVYAKAGHVLRARSFEEGPPELTAEGEAQHVAPSPSDH